jgi:hypothetical protein
MKAKKLYKLLDLGCLAVMLAITLLLSILACLVVSLAIVDILKRYP